MRTVAAWAAGLAVLGVGGLVLFFYAPDKPRAVLEAANPGTCRTINGLRFRLRDT